MSVVPNVLLLDDGELDDIQQMLVELDVPVARVRGGAIVDGTPAPRDLLVATPRRIGAVEQTLAETNDPPVRVMVVDEDSNALRAQLRRSGFEFLVRRPVHAEALRLLLLHCLYKGEERRREPRVAVGVEVVTRSGLRSRRSTLADLSMRGCRLVSRTTFKLGSRIKVDVPEALEVGDPITLPGRVQRVVGQPEEKPEIFQVGVAFEAMDDDTRQALEVLIEDRASGPATLRAGVVKSCNGELPEVESEVPELASAGTAESSSEAGADEENAEEKSERRNQPRGAYGQTVPAFGERALRVLVGRDLSAGGMRVENQSEISLGDRLHLAIYGTPGDEPILVWGGVARDDHDAGFAIVFEEVDEATERRLERLVASLPPVESLQEGEVAAMGTVLSEIVG